MIRRNILKRLIAQGTALVALLTLVGVSIVAGRLVLNHLGSANVSQALHDVPELPVSAQNDAQWLPDEWHGERAFEPDTRRELEAAYVDGWEGIARYQETGDSRTVIEWLAGPARQQALAAPVNYQRQVWAIGHRLALSFYSLDGATAAVRDSNATIVYESAAGGRETITTTRETYDSVLTLEDGYWRIRQLRRISSQLVSRVSAPTSAAAGAGSQLTAAQLTASQTQVSITAAASTERHVPKILAGSGAQVTVDWTPPVAAADTLAAQPASFDRQMVQSDFDAAKAIGLNLVAITVPADAFGAIPSAAGITLIRQVLSMAAADGLRVEVTIDGAGTDRGVDTWTEADHRLTTVVSGLAGEPALALWNLAQAPDRWVTPPAQRQAWLLRAALAVHRLDPATPVTIGWAQPAEALDAALGRQVDVTSLPWQGSAQALPPWLTAARAVGRPILLTLTANSWNGIWPGGHTEGQQAAWFGQVLSGARSLGVPIVSVSALRDGEAVAGSRLPWVAGPKLNAGLLRRDWSAKPAANVVGLGTPGPQVKAVLAICRKPFWWVLLIAVTLCVPGLPGRVGRSTRRGWGRNRRRRRGQESSIG
jgi:hypothetical protein